MHAVAIGLFVAWGWALLGPGRRAWATLARTDRRTLAGVSLLGVAVRALVSPWAMAPVPDLYETRMLLATGLREAHPIYGWGITGLGGLMCTITGTWPEGWLGLQLGASCLLAPLAWTTARLLLPREEGRFAALVAGGLAAVLSPSVLLAASVSEHTLVATLLLLGLCLCLAGRTGSGTGLAALGALTGAFATHVRPEALPVAGLLLLGSMGPLWRGRRAPRTWAAGAAVLGAAGLVGLRVLHLEHLDTARRVLTPDRTAYEFVVGTLWSSAWEAPGMRVTLNALANARLVPLGAWPLAVVGAVVLARRRHVLASGVWLAAWLPVCLRGEPLSDALRMQLPGLALAMPLVGVGAAAAAAHWPWLRRGLPIAWGLMALPMLVRDRAPWIGTANGAVLLEGASRVPDGTRLVIPRIDSYAVTTAGLAELAAARRTLPLVLRAQDALPEGPAWVWWGLQCATDLQGGIGGQDRSICRRLEPCLGAPAHARRITGRTEPDWPDLSAGVEVGWYELGSCPALSPPEPRPATPPPGGRSSGR
jgi:hypothetical protein